MPGQDNTVPHSMNSEQIRFLGQCFSRLLPVFSWHLITIMGSNPVTYRCHHNVKSNLTCLKYGSHTLVIESYMMQTENTMIRKDALAIRWSFLVCMFFSFLEALFSTTACFCFITSSPCSVRLQTPIYSPSFIIHRCSSPRGIKILSSAAVVSMIFKICSWGYWF